MVVDTQKLLDEIEQFEANEMPDLETVPMAKLNVAEKRGLEWRKTINDFCALAEKFHKSVEFCMAGEVDFSK